MSCWRPFRRASSIASPALIAWSTTSAANRRRRSSGNKTPLDLLANLRHPRNVFSFRPEKANMRFTKMHGLGNDYIYVDCFHEKPPRDGAALSRVISDRHFGVGADGLILICPSERADARMRMFNADGSEAEMCGNGLRCVAKFVHDHGIAQKPQLKIETGRGILTVDLELKNNKVNRVRVNM